MEKHAGHGWKSKNKFISDVLLWTPLHGRASVGQRTRTCQQQLYTDTGCSQEEQPEAMDDRDEWRARSRKIHSSNMT